MEASLRRSAWPRPAIRRWREFRDDARATALVEAALILPSALLMFALLIFGAEGFAINRKVTVTARTVTDLITQATPTQYSHQASVMSAASISNYLQVASSVLAPYSASNMTMVVSQVVVNSGGTTGTVTWSEPYNGATARPANQVINLPGTIGTGQVGNYFVLGEVYYNYIPLNFYMSLSAIPLYGSIFLTPRQSTSIICSDCVTPWSGPSS
ncbi:MAG: TadE/TadG family type IV pilus assembly protein [Roseiarcus sp.]